MENLQINTEQYSLNVYGNQRYSGALAQALRKNHFKNFIGEALQVQISN